MFRLSALPLTCLCYIVSLLDLNESKENGHNLHLQIYIPSTSIPDASNCRVISALPTQPTPQSSLSMADGALALTSPLLQRAQAAAQAGVSVCLFYCVCVCVCVYECVSVCCVCVCVCPCGCVCVVCGACVNTENTRR